MTELMDQAPGADLIEKGLEDLRRGLVSAEALLVLIGSPRLKRLGLNIPNPENSPAVPEHALYQFLQQQSPRDAYGRYNALIRRLVSYERTAERLTKKERINSSVV